MSSQHLDRDDYLLLQIRNGNEEAFRASYWKYHKSLYALAYRYLKDQSLAEDAVQDVFVKLWTNRTCFHDQSSLKGFLYTSLKHHLLNAIRHQKTVALTHAGLQAHLLRHRNETEENYLSSEYSRLVETGIRQLSPQRQRIFRLRTFEGMDNVQIATQLRLSIHTVKFQFTQATRFLREYLKSQANIGG